MALARVADAGCVDVDAIQEGRDHVGRVSVDGAFSLAPSGCRLWQYGLINTIFVTIVARRFVVAQFRLASRCAWRSERGSFRRSGCVLDT
jgi:hypothetical protein